MARILFLALAAVVFFCTNANAVVYNVIPCKNLPPEAKTEVPDLLAAVGKISCTPYGQMMEPRTGYWWPYNNIQPVLIPAQKDTRNPERSPNKFYFTDFVVAELSGDEKQKWLDMLYDRNLELYETMSHKNPSIKEKAKEDMLKNRPVYMAKLQKEMQVFHMVALSSDNGFERDIYLYKSQEEGLIYGLTYMADNWRLFGIARIVIVDHFPL